MEAAAEDPATDGLLVILTPQAMSEPTRAAEALKAFAHLEGKPILASWMGGADVAAGVEILNRVGIPTFVYPDTAARVFHAMWRSTYNLRAVRDPHRGRRPANVTAAQAAEAIGTAVRGEGRTILTALEAQALLAAYAIPRSKPGSPPTRPESVAIANALGYPVAVKLASTTHHSPSPRSAESGSTCLTPKPSAAPFAAIETSVRERAGAADPGASRGSSSSR